VKVQEIIRTQFIGKGNRMLLMSKYIWRLLKNMTAAGDQKDEIEKLKITKL
jgi:hypothetical protein